MKKISRLVSGAAISIALVLYLLTSAACRQKLDINQNTNGSNNVPGPTPARELNEKRLEAMNFEAWHRSKPGVIIKNLNSLYYLDKPAGKLVSFNEYKIDIYSSHYHPENTRSHSGKFEIEVRETGRHVRYTECCAIQEIDKETVISEIDSPADQTKLADTGWDFKEWSPDDRFILFSDGDGFFLVNAGTKERTSIPVKAPCVFAANGKGLFGIQEREGIARLAYYDIAAGQSIDLFSPVEGTSEISLSPGGNILALHVKYSQGGAALTEKHSLYVFDAEKRVKTGEYSLPQGDINFLFDGWKTDGSEIGFTLGGRDYAKDVYSIETQTGKLIHWYPPEGETTALYK